MKLLRLQLDGFGALRGEFRFDPDKVTLLVDDNERGKSTLLAAVASALYGLDNDKRKDKVITPLERWRPWQGGSYRVELDVDADGRRLTIKRDFDRNLVEVWDEQGQEITAEFREGKDQFPVGKKLVGLDADEFARCSFIAFGDLGRVVPQDPRERASSSLRARLESAADSKLGDTNATEAMNLIDGALRKYTCPEVESSIQVDTTIQRLELKRGTLETEIKTLEHDLETIQTPLDELARLNDEEQRSRSGIQALEAELSGSLANGLRSQLAEDSSHREEVAKLQADIDGLTASAHLPVTAEAMFRETFGRYEEQRRNLETLEGRKRDEIAREREAIEREMGELAPFATASEEDADRCVSLAAELKRVSDEDQRLRDEVFSLRETLASKGHEPERLQWLNERFGTLAPERQSLLRRQSDLQLQYQTEVAGLERERTASTETLREIDALRNRWRLPGWFLIALGLAAAVAGGAVMMLNGLPVLWTSLLAAGAVLLSTGLVLMGLGGRARDRERGESLKRLTDAQRKLTTLKQTRAETEVSLQIMARQMGYRDHIDLLREWSEFGRLMDESGPALQAQSLLAGLEHRRSQAADDARVMLDRFGGGMVEPMALEMVATRIRRALGMVQKAKELEKRYSWIDEEKRVVEAQASGLQDRALRLLQSAGLTYDPDRSWEDHAKELAERVAGRVRLETLQNDLLPRARARLLDEAAVANLRGQLASIEASLGGAEAPRSARTALEIEAETRRLRESIDTLQRRRQDLRVQVEEGWRRFHSEHPDKVAQKERIEIALLRARRFKHAAELARDTIQKVAAETHRRWADYLNHRVGELLDHFGTGIEQLRFGDDLDFSVKVAPGQQLARGKADLQLSAGARDQLYLAVRLAVSEFLSRGQSVLPFLLDDVFVTSDDGRTRAGMRLLTDTFAKEHQVVLLTCHRQRFEALAAQEPELYRERVQWLDLNAIARSTS